MAIGAGKLKTKSLVTLADTKVITSVDRSKDTGTSSATAVVAALPPGTPATTKASVGIGKKNLADIRPVPAPSATDIAMGIITTPSLADALRKVDPGVVKGNRSLTNPILSGNVAGIPLDSANTALSDIKAGLPEHTVKAMEDMGTESAAFLQRHLTIPGLIDKKSVGYRAALDMGNKLKAVGGTLKEKVAAAAESSCKNRSGANAGTSQAANKAAVGAVLSQSLCVGSDKLLMALTGLSGSGAVATKDLINGTANALLGNLNTSNAEKIKIMAKLDGAVGNASADALNRGNSLSQKLIGGLSNKDKNARGSSGLQSQLTGCLDKVDPGWDLDAGGTSNLSATKGSGYMDKLAAGAVKANTATSATITATPSFNPANDRSLGILASNMTTSNIRNSRDLPAVPPSIMV